MENKLQPHELRIGNLIEFDGKICIVKVIGEYSLTVTHENERFHLVYNEISPILITEELLLKFGFYKATNTYFRLTFGTSKNIKEIVTLHYNINTHSTCLVGDEAWEAIYLKYLVYIHQMQNLFYSLYNDELKIDLK